jgi:hypothetical protein
MNTAGNTVRETLPGGCLRDRLSGNVLRADVGAVRVGRPSHPLPPMLGGDDEGSHHVVVLVLDDVAVVDVGLRGGHSGR